MNPMRYRRTPSPTLLPHQWATIDTRIRTAIARPIDARLWLLLIENPAPR